MWTAGTTHRAVTAAALAAGLWTAGCSAHRPPATPAAPPAQPTAAETGTATESPAETPEAAAPRLRDLCHEDAVNREFLDETRRLLQETFCGANLWFDGLFGGEPDIENARQVSGRVELSTLYTEFDGLDVKGRLRLRYDLPTLDRRVNVFLGRDDREEIVEDRQEGFAIRSSVFGLETEEQWLAGLGYSPPGHWAKKIDFRVGGRLKTAPEVFAQSRYRHNLFLGEDSVWRFRETVFWENRAGFGATTSADFDHVVRHNLLFRWGNVGTFSESTDGLAWRSAAIAYYNLRQSRAVAAEVFLRGSTGADVKLREYGTRAVYRQPVGKPYLFGELIAGYTWPQKDRDQPREGSAMLGLGLELLFGREPH